MHLSQDRLDEMSRMVWQYNYRTSLWIEFNYGSDNDIVTKVSTHSSNIHICLRVNVNSLELTKQTENNILDELKYVTNFINKWNFLIKMRMIGFPMGFDEIAYSKLINKIDRQITNININSKNFNKSYRDYDEMTGIYFDEYAKDYINI